MQPSEIHAWDAHWDAICFLPLRVQSDRMTKQRAVPVCALCSLPTGSFADEAQVVPPVRVERAGWEVIQWVSLGAPNALFAALPRPSHLQFEFTVVNMSMLLL